jgi:hypothetical protein
MDVNSWTNHRVAMEIRGLVDMLGDKRSGYAQTMIEQDVNGSAFTELNAQDLIQLGFSYGHAKNLASHIQRLLAQDAGTVVRHTDGPCALDAAGVATAAFERLEESTKTVVLQVRSDCDALMCIIRKIQKWFHRQVPKITNADEAAKLTDKQLDLINELLLPHERNVLTAWNRSRMTCYFGPTETVPFFAGFEHVLFIPEATDEEIKSILNADHSPSSTAGGTTTSYGATKISLMIKALKEKREDLSPICKLCWQPGHQQKACMNVSEPFPEDELLGAEMKKPRRRE